MHYCTSCILAISAVYVSKYAQATISLVPRASHFSFRSGKKNTALKNKKEEAWE